MEDNAQPSTLMRLYWLLIKWYWPVSIVIFTAFVVITLALKASAMVFFGLMVVIVICVSIPTMVVLVLGSRERLKEVSPKPDDPILFIDRTASGVSNRLPFYFRAGAAGCMVVTVTKDFLFVHPWGLFSFASDLHDLNHKVPINSISSCENKGRSLRIRWQGPVNGDFTLKVSDPTALLASIGRP